jgi:restriction endonuclease S subunit
MMIYQKYQKPTKRFYLRIMVTRKIKIRKIRNSVRFNGGYYLNDDALNSSLLEDSFSNCKPLEELASVWNPPIFKRQFCKKTDRAIPYCQSGDITNALEGSDVYINKIQATKVGSVVKENQILVTGFGTIGNTRLINKLSAGISYANNACRIQVNQDGLYGYIYAVMSSKYGVSQLNKNASGSVVRYIEAPGIKKTLIPILPKSKQEQIHRLMVEANELRIEANTSLKKAANCFEELKTDYSYGDSISTSISIKKISSNYKRFDSLYGIVSEKVENSMKARELNSVKISSQASDIFIGPRSKRNYVKNGVPFLTTSAMQKANPTKADRQMTKSGAVDFQVKEGWILTTRSGTLGDTSYVLPCINNYAVSEDAIRIVLKEDSMITKEYLYAFLKSKIGRSSLLSGSYGSVIQHLNESYVGNIKIPVLEEAIVDLINNNVKIHISSFNQAILKENQAIDLVEKEIEQWEK